MCCRVSSSPYDSSNVQQPPICTKWYELEKAFSASVTRSKKTLSTDVAKLSKTSAD